MFGDETGKAGKLERCVGLTNHTEQATCSLFSEVFCVETGNKKATGKWCGVYKTFTFQTALIQPTDNCNCTRTYTTDNLTNGCDAWKLHKWRISQPIVLMADGGVEQPLTWSRKNQRKRKRRGKRKQRGKRKRPGKRKQRGRRKRRGKRKRRGNMIICNFSSTIFRSRNCSATKPGITKLPELACRFQSVRISNSGVFVWFDHTEKPLMEVFCDETGNNEASGNCVLVPKRANLKLQCVVMIPLCERSLSRSKECAATKPKGMKLPEVVCCYQSVNFIQVSNCWSDSIMRNKRYVVRSQNVLRWNWKQWSNRKWCVSSVPEVVCCSRNTGI